MDKTLDIEFEQAVRLLAEHLPISDATSRKPVLAHSIRVGTYLYQHNYSREIILPGLLHDALEFSNITEQVLRDEFGDHVTELVKACTKDDLIQDPVAKTNELIKRCAAAGQDALIVKAADILDSFNYYTKTRNADQLEYCRRNAQAILEFKPTELNDKIFLELKQWL